MQFNPNVSIGPYTSESGIIELIEKNTGIESLEIKACTITPAVWKVIMTCDALKTLILKDSQLEIPEDLSRSGQLKVLNLQGSSLTKLPENIGQLPNLEILNLSYTRIVCLPKSLNRSSSLRQLNVMGCKEMVPSTLRGFREKHQFSLVNP